MPRRSRAGVVVVFATLAAAASTLPGQAPKVRDSSGVRITENPARMTFPVTLKLAEKPTFDVGGLHDTNPDEEFDSHQGYLRGVILSDGGIAVIDVSKVKYFDRTGKLVKVAGRSGDGPGEFRYLTAICRTHGDTIVVSDRSRLGVLDKNGNFVRHIPSAPRYLPFDGCFDDGTVLLSTSEQHIPTPFTSTAHLWRVGLDGTTVISLGDLVVAGFDMVIQGETTWAAGGTSLVVGDAARTDIPIFRLAPLTPIARPEAAAPLKLTASIRSADPVLPLTDADAERRMAGTIPNNVSASERSSRMDRMKSMPHAAKWPSYGRVYVDPVGSVWVADYLTKWPSPTGYSKFDPSGRLVGRLIIPAATKIEDRLEVIGFGRDNILVRRWDGDGATHLSVYPLVPVK